MLKEILITNYAIIKQTSLAFKKGFNLITGETGAGKSLLIDAVRILCGSRVSPEIIKKNEKNCSITAIFEDENIAELKSIFEELAIPYSKEIIIRRLISKTSSTKNFINDIPVTANSLKKITACLIEMHGQFENQSLLFNSEQLKYLDKFADTHSLLKKYYIQYNKIKNIEREIENLKALNSISESEIDWKKSQIEELSTLKISNEEYLQLINKTKIMEKSKIILDSLKSIQINKDGHENPILSNLNNLCLILKNFVESNQQLKNIYELSQNVNSLLLDLFSEINYYIEDSSYSEEDINSIQEKLFKIQKFLRKYKVTTVTELENKYKNLSEQMINIEQSEIKISKLKEQLKNETNVLTTIAKNLSEKRIQCSKQLEKKVTDKLKLLAMADAEFKINIEFDKKNMTQTGFDKIIFMIKTNKGSEFGPLKNVVSGGEMSRLMLTLKSLNAESDEIPSIIFDEIDSGISGSTASKVADELFHLGKTRQVMCITHQPAIAAIPGVHYKIEKFSDSKQTITMPKFLTKTEKIEEVANLMAGGKITKSNLISAQELINNFQKK